MAFVPLSLTAPTQILCRIYVAIVFVLGHFWDGFVFWAIKLCQLGFVEVQNSENQKERPVFGSDWYQLSLIGVEKRSTTLFGLQRNDVAITKKQIHNARHVSTLIIRLQTRLGS